MRLWKYNYEKGNNYEISVNSFNRRLKAEKLLLLLFGICLAINFELKLFKELLWKKEIISQVVCHLLGKDAIYLGVYNCIL